MRIFSKTPTIDFMGKKNFFVGLSIVAVIFCLVLIATRGIRYGIDFSGGIEMQVKIDAEKINVAELRKALEDGKVQDASVVEFKDSKNKNEFLISMLGKSEMAVELSNLVRSALNTKYGEAKVEIRKAEVVGAKVGADLKKAGLYSVLYSLVALLIYVWFRFDLKFAPGAVICLIHDSIITVGVFSLLQREFNLTILAAVLTIIGYSLNDTIVIYDRVRENVSKAGGGSLTEIINRSVNETLSRSVLTNFTVFISVLALYLKGGPAIEDFALAMIIGVAAGSYSTIFVAAPLVIAMEKILDSRAAKARA